MGELKLFFVGVGLATAVAMTIQDDMEMEFLDIERFNTICGNSKPVKLRLIDDSITVLPDEPTKFEVLCSNHTTVTGKYDKLVSGQYESKL